MSCLIAQAHGSLTAKPFSTTNGLLSCLGAGYLIGIVGGLAMLFGTFLAWGVAVPYFTATGDMPTDAPIVSYAMTEWKRKFALSVWVPSVLRQFGHY